MTSSPASGFLLAVVFTVQGLTGWEAAVPLAEETENPRRNVPVATMASIVIVGVMLVLVFWGQVVGWGTTDLTKLPRSEEIPALMIAHRVWGSLWWLALLAMFTSVIGASLACQNVATRMWFGMGRSGVAARRRSPRSTPRARRRPTRSRRSSSCRSCSAWSCPQWIGPANAFILTVGYMLVIARDLRLHHRERRRRSGTSGTKRRDEFNWILHFDLPGRDEHRAASTRSTSRSTRCRPIRATGRRGS